ncbi:MULTISPECIES: alpha/beta fold hydrolase [unclassified Leptolyngbya]|uniref:alpha/beta fold hydrolase n=1 Tax=unclassified Leptolyngbya TaxID=2650499 RepID=UPI0016882AC6|nr:alpha/beta fold hydrolase [Leptolyngbya sp. FACHB-8]MBD2155980.1 alpha/beta fold hydrolase [Leptolyngbya sp. FACHB-16]
MTISAIPTSQIEFSTWNWQGHRIRYTVRGQGTPIVLIHGFGASIGHWRKNIPVLAEVGYRVFAIDLLGFGGSDKPALDYSLELWENLLADFSRELIQAPAVWAGNSIGALLALMMLAHHPDLSRGGVLLNAAGGLNHRPEELNPPLRMVMGTFSRVVSSPGFGPLMFNLVRQKSRIRSTLQQVYCDRTAVTDELVDIIYEPSCDPGAQQVFASILTAPPGPHPSELLPKITQPLLILWGAADPWTPISGSKLYQMLAEQEPERIQFASIPNTGHCPHDERPEQVNAYISDWLKGLE